MSVQRAVLRAIAFYRSAISPNRPPACRFTPSCSAYTYEAIESYGLWRGMRMGAWRLLRCHPFHPGGHDPVPPRVGDTILESTSDDAVETTDGAPVARSAA